MKTKIEKWSRPFIQIGLIIVFLLLSTNILAQEETSSSPGDTIGHAVGKLTLGNPNSMVSAYTYDAEIDRYVLNVSVEGYNVNYPTYLTPQEYRELVQRESIRSYFKEKVDALEGVKDGTDDAQRNLLPRYYVNSSLFESIFGSNTIDVQPRGSVEMDLGIRYTKQDNPSFSPRNRSQLSFDFEQRISMSLTGKVGTRLGVNANYDTQSTFAFQNLIKLDYTPDEDAILRKLEVGNVSLPLNNTLVRGAQSLFGVKAELQFGKTTVTGIFSEQKSQTKSVTAQGGGTMQDFEIFALDYDQDRHFFLSQYFRNRYDAALRNYPFIDSRVQITRIEVWVTNRQNRVTVGPEGNNLRNIIALQDLGEARLIGVPDQMIVGLDPAMVFDPTVMPNTPPQNKNNFFDPGRIQTGGGLLNARIREIVTAGNGFNFQANEGRDYSKLENARKLTSSEFTFHPQLGYISLNQKLSNDEVLAVAYQYTIGDQVYQVGEFGNDGIESTMVDNGGIPITQSLILKMLKSNLTNTSQPIWNLMMKNIYQIPGAFQLTQDDFKFNILYTDPSPLNYIVPAEGATLPDDVAETPLLRVFNVDRLNFNNDPQHNGDGFFDFVPGLTVDSYNGRIIFTTVEPFGSHLFEKLSEANEDYDNEMTYNANQNKYVYSKMYRESHAMALQQSEKNKFLLKGRYKSESGDGYPIGGMNIPRGSVVVTAGGRTLVEGTDYIVNYQLGRVRILDPSLQASGVPIEITSENNAVFGQQTRRFFGVNVEHKFSDKLQVGGTYLRMSERPFTQKSNIGQESINNTIFGLHANYSTEVPFFTRLANKLPFVDTDVPSNLSLRGEIAFLKPDAPKVDNMNGESTLYVDDFEGSQSNVDMKSPLSWTLASVPENNQTSPYNFNSNANDLTYGFKRAKLSWYTIDPIFYTSQRPNGITDSDLATNKTRRVYINEVFPVNDIVQGQTTVLNTLDLTYYPRERGPYNFNPAAINNALLPNPEQNFGGIMRAINTTNFEQSNVEYIQFWMLDPYVGAGSADMLNQGKIYFNIGEISEDVLKDGRKMYENGLPTAGSSQPTIPTIWGKVPASQSLIYAFDTNESNRVYQDLGLDGINDEEEAALFPQFANVQDPAADNFEYYLNVSGDILTRYKNYNGLESNSPVSVTDTNRGNSTLPDVEDINRDNTMNTVNAYFEYAIDLHPNMQVGQNFVTDIRETQAPIPGPGNQTTPARWIQFKIPVNEPANVIGGISDFRSIRFMRMFMTGFTDEITVRFGTLELIRGEWRRYVNTLDPQETNDQDALDDTTLDVMAVNIQENGNRQPINYVLPPGVTREQLYNQNTVVNQNEQSLALRISKKNPLDPGLGGLEPGDSRAVFKSLDMDFRQFKKLRMFAHAEALPAPELESAKLQDDEMVVFIRFGNDFTQNFYQVEVPLKVTPHGLGLSAEQVWPEENEMELHLSLLTKLKIMAINGTIPTPDEFGISYIDEVELDPAMANKRTAKLRLGIKGNPNFGFVRTLMIGVKNNTSNPTANLTERPIRGEVWVNELRVSDMDTSGGMAAILNLDTNIADVANLSATGRMNTIGFGALEQGPNERLREDMNQYNIVTNVNLEKFLPSKWGMKIPFNYGVGEQTITPEYDPFNQDIRLQQLLSVTSDEAERENMKNRAIEYTKTKSINFIGVRKERSPEKTARFYDVENLTLSHSFNEVDRHDYEIEDYVDRQSRTSADYAHTFQNKPYEPFKNTAFMKKSRYWKLLSDFNINFAPSSINFSSNIIRQFNRQQFRQVEVEGIGLTPLYRRNYLFNYQYGFNYNLTKALKLNYNVSTSNIVRSYMSEDGIPDESNGIWDDYWDIGLPNQHNQQFTLNYELPLNKLPFLSFLKSNYSYTSNFNWQRASLALASIETEEGHVYDLGNTIQNSGSHQLNATLNMDQLYQYLGIRKSTDRKRTTAPTAAPRPGQRVATTTSQNNQEGNVFVDGLIGVLTSVKNIQLTYKQDGGSMLPGYLPSIGFFGTARPSLEFVMGSQSDIRYEAAKNGWLTTYPDFNQSYTEMVNKQLNFAAKVDLFPDFTIDLTADRNYMDNFSEQYDVQDGVYYARSPFNQGNFAISTLMIKTAFSRSDENQSEVFDEFRQNRLLIADRLAAQYYGGTIPRYGDANNPIPLDQDNPAYNFYSSNEGFPIGFGKNSQSVLIPSFLAAYTGKDASDVKLGMFRDVPIPNWNIKYNGLMRFQFFKDRFKRFSIQHQYRSSYTINSFRSNFEYDQNPGGRDNNGIGNFYNKTLVSNINLVEAFNPLIRVDMELNNSLRIQAEVKKDRALSMSFDNNLLTEQVGMDYVFGLGYRIKDVIINSSLADNPQGIIRSDINLRADLSLRDQKTIVRYLDYDNNQLGGGQNIWSAKFTADYAFSKQLTVIFYYDHTFTKAVISTAFPMTNIRSGFTLRYNFGN